MHNFQYLTSLKLYIIDNSVDLRWNGKPRLIGILGKYSKWVVAALHACQMVQPIDIVDKSSSISKGKNIFEKVYFYFCKSLRVFKISDYYTVLTDTTSHSKFGQKIQKKDYRLSRSIMTDSRHHILDNRYTIQSSSEIST